MRFVTGRGALLRSGCLIPVEAFPRSASALCSLRVLSAFCLLNSQFSIHRYIRRQRYIDLHAPLGFAAQLAIGAHLLADLVDQAVDLPRGHDRQCQLLGTGSAEAKRLPPARITLAQVGQNNLGKYVTVRGTIIREDTFSKGWRLWIQDETGVAILHIQEPDYLGIFNPKAIANGAVVQFTGKVINPFREWYQVVPKRGSDIRVIAPAPPIAQRGTPRELGSLGPPDHKALVVVNGTVTGKEDCFVFGIDPRVTNDPPDPAICILVQDATGVQKLALPLPAARKTAPKFFTVGQKILAVGMLRAKSNVGLQIYTALPVNVVAR